MTLKERVEEVLKKFVQLYRLMAEMWSFWELLKMG